jgi:protein TonB
MVKDRVIRIAFLISFSGHLLFLGMPLFNLTSLLEESKEITVKIEIERPSLLPRIEVMGEEKRLKAEEREQKTENRVEPKIQSEEIVIEEPLNEPIKERVEIIDPAQEAMLRYQDIVKQRIEEARRYPSWAKRQGIEGKVHLSFVVVANGTTKDIKIIHSANSKILNEEAVATIQKANPFPPLPQEIEVSSLQMEVSLIYLLK